MNNIFYDELIERSILGTLLYEVNGRENILLSLTPEDFFNEINRQIFIAIRHIYEQGKEVNPLTVRDFLLKTGKFGNLNITEYIARLELEAIKYSVETEEVLKSLISVLREKAVLRTLSILTEDVKKKIEKGEVKDVNSLLSDVESRLMSLKERKEESRERTIKDVIINATRLVNELAKHESYVTGIPSGFYEIDRMTTGFHSGELIIIAARPGMGKTSFALSSMLRIIKEGIPAAFFSLEMSAEDIGLRILSLESGIPLKKIRSGSINEEEINLIINTTTNFLNMKNVIIDDTPSLTLFDLKTKIKKFKKEYGIEIVFIDYLQLLRSGSRRYENRQQEVAEISRGLKSIAKEFNIPIVSLSQLSRQAEMRADKRPQLSDLRESGSIEQDADVVIFIHRPEYYKKTPSPQEEGLAEIIIAKQRNGPTGIVKLAFLKELTKFESISDYSNIQDTYQTINEDEEDEEDEDDDSVSF